MPVTLPDILPVAHTVDLRGVAVPVRGFTFLECGPLLAKHPAFAAALNGDVAAILVDRPLLEAALALAELDEKSAASLDAGEQVAVLKEIFRLTFEDAIGPFVDLAASLGGSAATLVDLLTQRLSTKSSSPPIADSGAADTAKPKS